MIISALLTGLAVLPAQSPQVAGLPDVLHMVNAYAKEKLPALQPDELKQLLGGEVVGLYLPPTGDVPCKAVGLLVSSQPRDKLWLAIRTLQLENSDDYLEQRLGGTASDEIWYGHLKLPLLFGRRHWLIEAGDNHVLAAATGNIGWEHHWQLVAGGETKCKHAVRSGQVKGVRPKDLEDTIYTPANKGSWVLIALPGGKTLIGYQVIIVIGGFIPDQLVARYSLYRMTDLLRDLEQQAASIHKRYTTKHAPVLGGDGLVLPRFGVKR